jgi:hypothetical protein
MPEGTISFNLNKNDMWKIGTLSVSPFNWLEASYFYYRPSDLIWMGGDPGRYLDKGFNIKFIYRNLDNKKVPNIAVGLDDFAGTGYFNKEYVVATHNINNVKYTLGIGWGKFTGENSFKNPLSVIKSSLQNRPLRSENYNKGGSLSYDKWFAGDAAFFGGLQYFSNSIKGLSLKLEYDPFNYFDFSAQNRKDTNFSKRKKDAEINLGLSYQLNNFLTIETSYIKGNQFNLNINLAVSLNESIFKKNKFSPQIISKEVDSKKHIKNNFYENLLYNLNNNRLFLQTASLNYSQLDIAISTSEHRNSIRSASYAAYVANETAKESDIDLNSINITHINAGIELNNISFIAGHFDKERNMPIEIVIRNTDLNSGTPNSFINNEFRPSINFPVIFSSFSPAIVSHIGNPEKIYFGGLNIQNIAEIQFNRNFLLSSEINIPLYHNFENSVSGASSKMEHVRTDIIQYLKEDDIHINRLQLDYIWSPYKDLYSKISFGIFEQMFGGFGGEILYKPFNRNFYIGAELFHVKQREYNQLEEFKDYSTVTGHINLGYMFIDGIEANISFGRYLAKDDGFTFDIGRRTKSGFKSGIYFTRTNVPPGVFGEGSFDKGFYFQIPMDLLSDKYINNYSTFKLSPLTRDGGAKLIHAKDLRGLIYNSTIYELNNQWDGFLN